MGICDNRGWAAGFGDSGIQKNTSVPDAGVPYAFWYTKTDRVYWAFSETPSQGWS